MGSVLRAARVRAPRIRGQDARPIAPAWGNRAAGEEGNKVETEILDPEGRREHFSLSESEVLPAARDDSLLTWRGPLVTSPALSSTTWPWLPAAPGRANQPGALGLQPAWLLPLPGNRGFLPSAISGGEVFWATLFLLIATWASWPVVFGQARASSSGSGLALAEAECIRISTPGSAGPAPNSQFLASDLPGG